MKEYKVNSKTVTKKVITVELDEELANLVAKTLRQGYFKTIKECDRKHFNPLFFKLEELTNSIAGHL